MYSTVRGNTDRLPDVSIKLLYKDHGLLVLHKSCQITTVTGQHGSFTESHSFILPAASEVRTHVVQRPVNIFYLYMYL